MRITTSLLKHSATTPVDPVAGGGGLAKRSCFVQVLMMTRKPYRITKPREKWSESEHERFTEGLKLYGRDWKQIVAHVGSRSVAQVRSHAQKYFLKLEKSGNALEVPPPRPKKRPFHASSLVPSKEGSPFVALRRTARQPKANKHRVPLRVLPRVLPLDLGSAAEPVQPPHPEVPAVQPVPPAPAATRPLPPSSQAKEDCQRISTSPSLTPSNSTALPAMHPSSASMDSITVFAPRLSDAYGGHLPATPAFQDMYSGSPGNFYQDQMPPCQQWSEVMPSQMVGQDMPAMMQYHQQLPQSFGIAPVPGWQWQHNGSMGYSAEQTRESSGSSHCSEDRDDTLPYFTQSSTNLAAFHTDWISGPNPQDPAEDYWHKWLIDDPDFSLSA